MPRPLSGAARPLLQAAFGGALYFLGYVGFGLWPLLLVFLVPLWLALDDGGPPATAPRAALLGLVFGATAYAGGFGWLWRLAEVFLAGNLLLGALLWLAYGAWFALGFAAYGALFVHLRRRGTGLAVAGVAPLLLVEWLQPQIFTVNAGAGLIRAPILVQIADLGGPLLPSALLGVLNVATFRTWRWWRSVEPLPLATWAVTALLVAATLLYGWQRTASVRAGDATAPELRVGIVQANLGVLEKRAQGVVTHQRHLEQTRELLRDGALDLVVWPETAYVRGIRRPLPVSGLLVVEDIGVPLLFGGTSVDERDGRRVKSNSAFLVAADGTIHDAYDKNLLIPLAEYAPLASVVPALGAWLPHVQDFAPSHATPALRLGPHRLAVPICYEAIRPDFVRRMVNASAPHLLVTLANDAWFGDSQEPHMHLALARLRAIEHRRWLVRATNSGISALIDPTGAVVARTGVLTRESLSGTVRLRHDTTLYGRLGDWPGWLALAAVVVGITSSRSRRAGGVHRVHVRRAGARRRHFAPLTE